MFCASFASDWPVGAISLGPITERNKRQPTKSGITFDAKQKIALSDKNYLNSILYSLLTFQIYEEKNRWEKYNIFFLLEYYAWFETKVSSTHLDTRQCCNRVNSQMYRDMLCHHMQVWDYCILVSFPADRHHNSSNIHSTSPNCPSFHQLQKKNGRQRHHQDQFHLPTILTRQALTIWRVFLLHCTSFNSALTHSTEISHLHKYYKFSGTWNTWKRDNCSNPFSCSVRISLCRIDRCLVLKKNGMNPRFRENQFLTIHRF